MKTSVETFQSDLETRSQPSRSPLASPCCFFGLLILGGSLLPFTSFGQEAVRASMAGEAAAAARRKAATTVDYYNLKAGDLRMRLQAGLEVEANDNVNLVDRGERSDVILRPQASTTFVYPITEHNGLNFNLGAGYSAYLRDDQLNRFFVTPGSEVSFDVFVGDCVINLHDRLTISQDAYQNPGATGSGDIGTLDNAAGVSTTWDLNDLVLVGGYDFMLRRSTTSGFDQQNADTHALHLSGGFRPNDSSIIRVDLGTSLIARPALNDGVQYNAGLSYQAQITDYISASAAAGYILYNLDQPALAGGKDRVSGMYANLGIQHRLNQMITYSLDAGRDYQVGLFSDVLALYYVRLNSSWKLIRKFSLSTRLSYEQGKETGGAGDQITRYGAGISLGRNITEKLNASLGYDFLTRQSDLPGRDYQQNRVLLNLTYAF